MLKILLNEYLNIYLKTVWTAEYTVCETINNYTNGEYVKLS